MLKNIKKVVATFVVLCYANLTIAQTLPTTDLLTGSTGINYTSANTWQNFSFNFTPSTTGSNYVGFAFRQDPAYWTLGNVSLTTGGGANLLTNGNFATGGTIPNGSGLQAPQYWGVWYQNNTVPAAAGSWYAPGTGWNGGAYTGGQGVNTSTAGSWIDGAVGSFDGIYQGVNLTAGTTYSLAFTVYGNNVTSSSVQLGAYGGACADTTIAATNCTMRSGTGFTSLATPAEGGNAGNTGPTIVSTSTTNQVTTSSVNGTSTSIASTAYGTTALAYAYANSRGSNQGGQLNVIRTTTTTATTPYTTTTTTTTPVTTTTTTTPVTTDTYSDGSTVVTNGSSTVTVTTSNTVTTATTTGDVVETTQSNQNYTTRVDQYDKLRTANQQMNQSIESDPWTRVRVDNGIAQRDLSGRSYNLYVLGSGLKTSNRDTYSSNGNTYGVGVEKLFTKNTLAGVAYTRGQFNISGDNAAGSFYKDAVNVYVLQSLPKDFALKADVGYAQNNYSNNHSIPELGLGNNGVAKGTDSWAQVKVYSPAISGFRVFAGGRSETNKVNSVAEAGSSVSAMTYGAVNQTTNSGLGGVRYDHNFTKKFAVGAETQYMSNQTTTAAINLTYHDDKNSSVLLKVARQNHNGQSTNMAALQARINF